MKLLDILKNVGTSVIKEVVPGGGLLIELVNGFLPVDKKLPLDASGIQVDSAINSLPPEQKSQLLNREFDVHMEELKTLQTMLTSDATSSHTTRPWIAKWSFVVLAVFSGVIGFIVISLWAYAVAIENTELVKAVVDGWPFVLALIGAVTGTLTILLKAYFGLLSKEHDTKIGGATGNFKPSLISGFFKNK